MRLSITMQDDFIFLFVDGRLVWTGSIEVWSFALANPLVVKPLKAA